MEIGTIGQSLRLRINHGIIVTFSILVIDSFRSFPWISTIPSNGGGNSFATSYDRPILFLTFSFFLK